MGNVIKIKHGDTIPTSSNLEQYELGYRQQGLYIKDENQEIIKLNFNTRYPNTTPNSDTPADWCVFGNCIITYTGTSIEGFDFPSNYGTLIQTVSWSHTSSYIQQTWYRQGFGNMWHRAGNSVGWNADASLTGIDSWKSILDERGGTISTSNIYSLTLHRISDGTNSWIKFINNSNQETGALTVRSGSKLALMDTSNTDVSYDVFDERDTIPITNGGTGATSIANARTNLGLGSLATKSSISLSSSTLTGVLPLTKGGTGINVASRSGLLDSLCDDSDTGWVSLTPSTNWGGENDFFVYRKIGPMVEMRFYLVATITTSDSGPWLLAYGLPTSVQPRNYPVRSTSGYHNGNPMTIKVNYYGTENAADIEVYGKIYDGYACWGQVTYFI